MAKRGRKPKNKVIEDLDASLQAEINEAIRSHADESAASIYRRFGLQQRGLVFSTFRKHVREVRLAAQGERITQPELATGQMDEPELVAKLRRRILVEALEDMDAGDTKLYERVSLLARLQDFDRIAIQREAETREAEKHEAWKEKERKRLKAEKDAADARLDDLAAESGIPVKVRDAVKALYGISL